MHSALRRFAATLVLLTPIALSGASGQARVRPATPREPRAITTAPLAAAPELQERAESSVILIVLDGVRWQEIFQGVDRSRLLRPGSRAPAEAVETASDLMPNLHRLIDEEGLALGAPAHGAEIDASGPQFISMPGYIEIFSGQPDRACGWNGCVPAPARTIADDVRDAGSADDVVIVTSWPNIARAASSRVPASSRDAFVISAGRTITSRDDVLRADAETARLLDEGARARAWPGDGGYRPDALTESVALRRLAVSHPRFFFVGLGDADEYAHHGDYRGYLQALRGADRFLGDLWAELSKDGGARARHTTLLVTADHGRAKDFADHGPRFPESGRVWLVAAGGGLERVGERGHLRARGLVPASRRHTLSDIAPTIRTLLGIEAGSRDSGGGANDSDADVAESDAKPADSRGELRPASYPIPEIVAIPGTM